MYLNIALNFLLLDTTRNRPYKPLPKNRGLVPNNLSDNEQLRSMFRYIPPNESQDVLYKTTSSEPLRLLHLLFQTSLRYLHRQNKWYRGYRAKKCSILISESVSAGFTTGSKRTDWTIPILSSSLGGKLERLSRITDGFQANTIGTSARA